MSFTGVEVECCKQDLEEAADVLRYSFGISMQLLCSDLLMGGWVSEDLKLYIYSVQLLSCIAFTVHVLQPCCLQSMTCIP
jgi:hypothetical protein